MSDQDQLRELLASVYSDSPRDAINTVASTLTDIGCPVLIVALAGGNVPLVRNSINIEQAGEEIARQVILAALAAVGVPRMQAEMAANLAAPYAVSQAKKYAAIRAARARAAAAAGRRGP